MKEPSHFACENLKWHSYCRNSLAVPQKVGVTIWPGRSTPRCVPKKAENVCSHGNFHTNVYCDIIYNSQKVETTQMSIT